MIMFLDSLFQTDEPVYPMNGEEQRVLSITDEAEDILGLNQQPTTQYLADSAQVDKVLSTLIDNTDLG